MKHEKELLDQPQSNETSIDEDFFGEVDNEVINESNDKVENKEEETTKVEETESKPTESENETETKIDYKPFLEAISKKAKYNGENVEVDDIDYVINNFQKGLNYDKLTKKVSDLENSKVFSYVSNKAKELGMTVDEYMEQVEAYEKEQAKAKEQERINEMIQNGVPEELAKEVVATSQLRKELQEEKNKLEKEKEEKTKEDKKNQEYADFLETFPDVKAEDIPKEVFLNAEKSNLKTAYLEWQNAELKKQIEINNTNKKNQKSFVGSTTDYGSKDENQKNDLFLEGFNSI